MTPAFFLLRMTAVTAGLLLAWSCAVAQEVTVERDSELRAEARLDAPVVASVKQGARGEVTAKSGAWLNVKTPAGAGWLFSFNVRFASAQQPGGQSASGDADVAGRFIGGRQQVNVTSAMGVRGIGEEDLKQAHFSGEQMKLLDQYAASRQDAENQARESGLAAVQVDDLIAGPK